MGPRFLVGGDFNAKHPWWGSRLINPKGRELHKTISANNFNTLFGGSTTYWPIDLTKIPDVFDFVVFNGISRHSVDILNDDSLSSDHTPILVNLNVNTKLAPKNVKLITKNSNMEFYLF